MSLSSFHQFDEKQIPGDHDQIPPPSHRHAAPSAPWPWVDIDDEVDPVQLESPLPPIPPPCDHKTCGGCWAGYPQSLFPNWTPRQVEKSKIQSAITDYRRDIPCKIYHVDVGEDGFFKDAGVVLADESNKSEIWERIIHSTYQDQDDLRIRALFIENMSGPILQMLGTWYNIEPFFFSSSLNWIPSRFQEEICEGKGDHITVTLTFLRSIAAGSAVSLDAYASSETLAMRERSSIASHVLDTQAPLDLRSCDCRLVLDLLSVHLIRRRHGSTIISFHPSLNLPTTTAPYLHQRIRFAGQSVYWQNIFRKYEDPTFVLIVFIWHAIYAWDESFENLYTHICDLESRVISTSEMSLTQELHIIRAHHLHYSSLLDNFRKTVEFVRDTLNPALESLSEEDRAESKLVMKRETHTLLSEIERLNKTRDMQDKRLKNVMNLVFSSVNIDDSKRMKKMTEASVRDSAAMKQIGYLTMTFLPAAFVVNIFSMNIREMAPLTKGTLDQFIAGAIPLTLATIWIIIAFQSKDIFPANASFWTRLGWPILMLSRAFGRDPYAKQSQEPDPWAYR